MTTLSSSGPAADATWTRQVISTRYYPDLTLYLLPEHGPTSNQAQPPRRYYLPGMPLLRRDGEGKPMLSLTLVLQRQPDPAEVSIRPLVVRGILTMTTTLDVELETLIAEYEALFARQGQVRVVAASPSDASDTSDTSDTPAPTQSRNVLCTTPISGAGANAALNLALDRQQTLDLLSALEADPADTGEAIQSHLSIEAEVHYRVVGRDQRLQLSGKWATLYDTLATHPQAQIGFTRQLLFEQFQEMISTGVVTLSDVSDFGTLKPAQGVDLATLFDRFLPMAVIILRAEGERYFLKTRPHPAIPLQLQLSVQGDSMRCATISGRIDQIVGGALRGQDWNLFVHLVTQTPTGTQPIARHTQITRKQNSRRGVPNGMVKPLAMAYQTNGSVPVAHLLQPQTTIQSNLHAVLASDLVASLRPIGDDPNDFPINDFPIDDIVIDPIPITPKPQPSLPIVDHPQSPVWIDRNGGARYWYAPVVEIVPAAPNLQPAASPFLFEYERLGVTGSGEIGLKATLRLTFTMRMSAESQRSLQTLGNPTVQPVPMLGLAASLLVPYVDDQDGQTKETAFTMMLQQVEDRWVATVEVLNQWVRLLYGVLTRPNFQQRPARLQVSYRYAAYVPTRREEYEFVLGGKGAILPIKTIGRSNGTERQPSSFKGYLDAASGTYVTPKGEFRFARESAAISQLNMGSLLPQTRLKPVIIAQDPTIVLARPHLDNQIDWDQIVQENPYVRQSLIRQQQSDLLYPCNTLGAFYRQRTPQGSNAIGCQDALSLGRTVLQLYEELPELRHAFYRVYRSLPQAGFFLIVPTYYRISRYASSETRAYKPCILIHAVIDPASPSNNRFVFRMTLQPDIPEALRRELTRRLRSYAANPIIQYPTEITTSEATYHWSLPSSIEVETVKMPDSLQVALQVDLASALLVQSQLKTSGIFGQASFRLPDGVSIESNLALELTQIIGPWEGGPVQITQETTGLRLTNRIEPPVAVQEVAVENASGRRAIAVDRTLAPAATLTLPSAVTGSLAGSDLYSVYTVQPGSAATIEELRSFIEDVEANVLFINQVNFVNHALQQMTITMRLKNLPSDQRQATLNASDTMAEMRFLLPITTYLSDHALQFQVTKRMQDGRQLTTPWFEWDLAVNGSLVPLTWELIQ